MADFCRDCTIEFFGEEYAVRNDFIFPSWEKGSFGWVLCEGCGYIVVNRHGQSLMPIPPDDGNKYQLGEDERTWVLVEADDA